MARHLKKENGLEEKRYKKNSDMFCRGKREKKKEAAAYFTRNFGATTT